MHASGEIPHLIVFRKPKMFFKKPCQCTSQDSQITEKVSSLQVWWDPGSHMQWLQDVASVFLSTLCFAVLASLSSRLYLYLLTSKSSRLYPSNYKSIIKKRDSVPQQFKQKFTNRCQNYYRKKKKEKLTNRISWDQFGHMPTPGPITVAQKNQHCNLSNIHHLPIPGAGDRISPTEPMGLKWVQQSGDRAMDTEHIKSTTFTLPRLYSSVHWSSKHTEGSARGVTAGAMRGCTQ